MRDHFYIECTADVAGHVHQVFFVALGDDDRLQAAAMGGEQLLFEPANG